MREPVAMVAHHAHGQDEACKFLSSPLINKAPQFLFPGFQFDRAVRLCHRAVHLAPNVAYLLQSRDVLGHVSALLGLFDGGWSLLGSILNAHPLALNHGEGMLSEPGDLDLILRLV